MLVNGDENHGQSTKTINCSCQPYIDPTSICLLRKNRCIGKCTEVSAPVSNNYCAEITIILYSDNDDVNCENMDSVICYPAVSLVCQKIDGKCLIDTLHMILNIFNILKISIRDV